MSEDTNLIPMLVGGGDEEEEPGNKARPYPTFHTVTNNKTRGGAVGGEIKKHYILFTGKLAAHLTDGRMHDGPSTGNVKHARQSQAHLC